MATVEDLRKVQQQVDALKERLDFMTPMLSALNFVQDYFQKVECEASVQLMRLKNGGVASGSNSANADKVPPQLVELAKWLHTLTDLAIRLHDISPGGTFQKDALGAPMIDNLKSAFPSLDGAGGRSSVLPSTLLQGGSPPRTAHGGMGPHASSPSQQTPSPSVPMRSPATPPAAEALPMQMRGPDHSGRSIGSTWSTDVDRSRESAFLRRAVSDIGRDMQPDDAIEVRRNASVTNRAYTGDTSDARLSAEPLRSDSSADCGGLALGQGTWANAYRRASGARRDALRLLYTSGIVTERELADDLTVISESHVEECVTIAAEMLKRWPPDHGPAPQREAKAFFEERLAVLYMSRGPAPFG